MGNRNVFNDITLRRCDAVAWEKSARVWNPRFLVMCARLCVATPRMSNKARVSPGDGHGGKSVICSRQPTSSEISARRARLSAAFVSLRKANLNNKDHDGRSYVRRPWYFSNCWLAGLKLVKTLSSCLSPRPWGAFKILKPFLVLARAFYVKSKHSKWNSPQPPSVLCVSAREKCWKAKPQHRVNN